MLDNGGGGGIEPGIKLKGPIPIIPPLFWANCCRSGGNRDGNGGGVGGNKPSAWFAGVDCCVPPTEVGTPPICCCTCGV
jgi:hypothetical protein